MREGGGGGREGGREEGRKDKREGECFCGPLLGRDGLGEVAREVDVDAVHDREVVREQLERDDVDETLKTVDRPRDSDKSIVGRERVVVVVADNDRLTLAGLDLLERRLDLRVERVLGHDEDDRKVLVDECEGAVLEFSGEDLSSEKKKTGYPVRLESRSILSERWSRRTPSQWQ